MLEDKDAFKVPQDSGPKMLWSYKIPIKHGEKIKAYLDSVYGTEC